MRMVVFILAVVFATGAYAETPQEGAAAILKLVKEKNYSVLFQTRYSEWYKAEAEGVKPDVAVQKLSKLWERNNDMMVGLFERLAKVQYKLSKRDDPLKTETGDVATATVSIGGNSIPYTFYKMKSGLWGFRI